MGSNFGSTLDGDVATVFSLSDGRGLSARISDFGATLVEVAVPDRHDRLGNLVLGFDSVEGYESPANAYFGATIGRVANRISGASFDLGGERWELAANEPPHHLHGGASRSFDKVLWSVARVGTDCVELAHRSPHGEEGYPGTVEVTAVFRLAGGSLTVEYRAVTDRSTPLNLTNHTYWNLAGDGQGTVLDHELQILADRYTPTDEALIPTGAVEDVAGSALDFRSPRAIGDRIGELLETPALGYDHNYEVRGRPGTPRLAARLRSMESGRTLEVHTDQPGLQVYSANRMGAVSGAGGSTYDRHGGLCLEPQHHPDAVHHPHFPSVILGPGQTYRHVTEYRFSVA